MPVSREYRKREVASCETPGWRYLKIPDRMSTCGVRPISRFCSRRIIAVSLGKYVPQQKGQGCAPGGRLWGQRRARGQGVAPQELCRRFR